MKHIASTLLMIRPADFEFNAQTAVNNRFQASIPSLNSKQIRQKVDQEFNAFLKFLQDHNIDVLVMEDTPSPAKPDAVFVSNWLCTLPSGKLIVFPLFAENRREEKRDEILLRLGNEFEVNDVEDWSEYEAEGFYLESTGSMVMDHTNKLIYASLSPRTHEAVLKRFAQAHGYQIISFKAKDENGVKIYHTAIMLHLGEGYAVVCLECIREQAQRIAISQSLIRSGREVITISLEQVHLFAGNMLQVENKAGKRITILSERAYHSLDREQKEALEIHTQLLPISIPTIETIGGGSVRCMMAEIFLKRKQSDSL